MALRLPEDDPKQGAPAWIVTFGDMMSLLLCFFVLLLSFSTMEMAKFSAVAGYIQEAFGVQKKIGRDEISAGRTMLAAELNEPSFNNEIVYEQMMEEIEAHDLKGRVEAEITEEGVRVRVAGDLIFPAGGAALGGISGPFVESVTATMRETGSSAIVEGHTDDVPPSAGAPFQSNWELAGARAGALVRRMIDSGLPPARFEAAAHAETRPLADNGSAAGRAKNRRVEVLLRSPL